MSPNLKQLVSGVTRLSPPAMLDPIISTLGRYYQQPVCLPPLDPDPDSNGSPSDHLIVVMKPLNTINNKPARTYKEVTVRPLPNSGLIKFKSWVQDQNWSEILNEQSVDVKAEQLHKMVMTKLDEFCPEKKIRISSDDTPWFNEQLKRLNRKKQREYNKNRNSPRYKKLQKLFVRREKEAKRSLKYKMIDDVMMARDGQWYSKLKRISNYDKSKTELVQVDEISHLSDQEQVEAIAESFSAFSNEFEAVTRDEIKIPP